MVPTGWDNVDTLNNTRGDNAPIVRWSGCVFCAARGQIGHPTHTWAAIVSADSAVMNLTTSEVTSHLEHTWPDRGPALTLRSYTHRDYVAKTAAGV